MSLSCLHAEKRRFEVAKVKRILIAAIAIVVALLIVVVATVSGYLVNYVIGCVVGGGGCGAEEVAIGAEGTRARIEASHAEQVIKTIEFMKRILAEQIEITGDGGVRLFAVVYG